MGYKYIVVIGFSAGGLVPLKCIFDNTRRDHGAYFILNHLPFGHQSLLGKILIHHSDLELKEATQGLVIKENVIYTQPQGQYITLVNNKLHLIDRDETEKINYSCDVFLHSLMKERTKNVIVIILSGAGRDGSQGISKIREHGGKVIVQEPESCEFSSMPEHAIETGNVDYISMPKNMPHLIWKTVLTDMGIM